MILLVSFTPIEARDNTMTSSVDSMFKRVETDSCPDPPRSANTRIAGTAGFAMGYPTVLTNKNDSPLYPLGVRPIPPPPTMPHFWQYPEYRTFASRYATFQDWPKFLRGPNKKDLARAGFIYTQTGDKVTCFCCGMTLMSRRRLPRTSSLVEILSVCSNGGRRKKLETRNFQDEQVTF